ncbi:hypothetical protein J4Q44_G00274770, partial [Coregonus suidteri]
VRYEFIRIRGGLTVLINSRKPLRRQSHSQGLSCSAKTTLASPLLASLPPFLSCVLRRGQLRKTSLDMTDSSGIGTPMVPQRSRTLFPRELLTRATAVWTRGPWHLWSAVSLNSTPDRLSGSAQLSLVSIRTTEDDGDFWNWTRS